MSKSTSFLFSFLFHHRHSRLDEVPRRQHLVFVARSTLGKRVGVGKRRHGQTRGARVHQSCHHHHLGHSEQTPGSNQSQNHKSHIKLKFKRHQKHQVQIKHQTQIHMTSQTLGSNQSQNHTITSTNKETPDFNQRNQTPSHTHSLSSETPIQPNVQTPRSNQKAKPKTKLSITNQNAPIFRGRFWLQFSQLPAKR